MSGVSLRGRKFLKDSLYQELRIIKISSFLNELLEKEARWDFLDHSVYLSNFVWFALRETAGMKLQVWNCAGMNVSDKTEKALLMRYSDRNGNIAFNDFVACYVKLKTMLSMCCSWLLMFYCIYWRN